MMDGMNKKIWIVFGALAVVAVGVVFYRCQTADILVSAPKANAKIASPLIINGGAVGGWYFEAVFPIRLWTENNVLIAQTSGQAQEDWMTSKKVPFSAELVFPTQPVGTTGRLVFQKDNPSGLPQNDKSYSINVRF